MTVIWWSSLSQEKSWNGNGPFCNCADVVKEHVALSLLLWQAEVDHKTKQSTVKIIIEPLSVQFKQKTNKLAGVEGGHEIQKK